MNRALCRFIVLCLTIAGTGIAHTEQTPTVSIAATREAYEAGEFARALQSGASIENPDALTLAAASALAQARFFLRGDGAITSLERAEELARKAIALDPLDIAPRLVLGVALGAQSREMTAVQAYFSDIATIGRREIDAMLAINPNEPRALALSGLWHLEVIRRAGTHWGSIVYGADRARGLMEFDEALAGAPNDPAIRVEFANALLALHDPELLDRARHELAQALQLPAHDAFERLTLEQGRKTLNQIPPETMEKQ